MIHLNRFPPEYHGCSWLKSMERRVKLKKKQFYNHFRASSPIGIFFFRFSFVKFLPWMQKQQALTPSGWIHKDLLSLEGGGDLEQPPPSTPTTPPYSQPHKDESFFCVHKKGEGKREREIPHWRREKVAKRCPKSAFHSPSRVLLETEVNLKMRNSPTFSFPTSFLLFHFIGGDIPNNSFFIPLHPNPKKILSHVSLFFLLEKGKGIFRFARKDVGDEGASKIEEEFFSPLPPPPPSPFLPSSPPFLPSKGQGCRCQFELCLTHTHKREGGRKGYRKIIHSDAAGSFATTIAKELKRFFLHVCGGGKGICLFFKERERKKLNKKPISSRMCGRKVCLQRHHYLTHFTGSRTCYSKIGQWEREREEREREEREREKEKVSRKLPSIFLLPPTFYPAVQLNSGSCKLQYSNKFCVFFLPTCLCHGQSGHIDLVWPTYGLLY